MLHVAALKSAAASMRDPLSHWDVNVVGTLRLLQSMDAAGCRRLAFSLPATIYSARAAVNGAILEGAPLIPVTSCHCDTSRPREILGFASRNDAGAMCTASWAWMQRRRGKAS